jgi:thioredoxin-dependent peroxiredoxin
MKLWLRKFADTRLGRFIKRYWWAYLAWRVLKWGVIGVISYAAFANPKEKTVEPTTPSESTSAAAVLNITTGDALPAFTLPAWIPGSETAQPFDSGSLKGKSAFVLYFYPQDDTPGCTAQACALRDGFEELSSQGFAVFGVSADSHESHVAFAQKYELPFALLVDEGGALRKRLGNPDGSEPLISRMTYIVDREGIVRDVVGGPEVRVDDHVAAVKEWAAKLKPAIDDTKNAG